MMRGTVLVLLVAAGCGAPEQRDAQPATPGWPELCWRAAHGLPEDTDCWRPHFPVRPCDTPTHPEVIGLWGHEERYSGEEPGERGFRPRILYDGCYVTIQDLRMTLSIDMVREELQYQGPLNMGLANRTCAVWDGDFLLSISHLNARRPIVARRELTRDGTARLVFVEHGVPTEPLVRFQPPYCIDLDTRDMLCVRSVLPLGTYRDPGNSACASRAGSHPGTRR